MKLKKYLFITIIIIFMLDIIMPKISYGNETERQEKMIITDEEKCESIDNNGEIIPEDDECEHYNCLSDDKMINENNEENGINENEEKSEIKNDDRTEIEHKEDNTNMKKNKNDFLSKSENVKSETINKKENDINIVTASGNNNATSATNHITDGTYKISTALNNKLVFDVDGGYIKNGANIQLYADVNVQQQKFNVRYLGDGCYSIIAVHSEKSLDVAWGGKCSGTNVQQYECNNTDSQKWIIQHTGDGYYNIISKCNGLYVDVTGGIANCGTNIQMYDGNNTMAQKFKFEKITTIQGENTIEDGIYKISTAINKSLVLDVAGGQDTNCANIQLYTDANVCQQKFIVKNIGNGFYTITAMHSKKCLDVVGGEKYSGVNVQQYEANNTDSQKWIIHDTGDGYYNIISKCNGLYVDVTGGNANLGTNIQMYDGNNTMAQKFKFEKLIREKGVQCIEDGEYKIELSTNNNMIFDIDSGSENNGARVQVWENQNKSQQRFIITYIGNGFYKIQSKKSGKVLDVPGASMIECTKVQQYENNDTSAQKWIIKEIDNGYYSFISDCNELYITASSDDCGAPLKMMGNRGTNNQKFVLKKIEELRGIDVSVHQNDIDWQKVKNSNIDFAIIRCGYGSDFPEQDDSKFQRNIDECERLNIPYGVYLYSYALNEDSAKSEANHVLRLIKGHDPELGVWLDMEDADSYKERNGMPSNDTLVNICTIFCDKMIEEGYKTGIYASLSWLNNQLDDSKLDKYDKWVAQWYNTCTYKKKYIMWQYSNSGIVDGIVGRVDMDIYYNR